MSCRTARLATARSMSSLSSPSPTMLVQSAPDGGIYDGINRGIARATGDVIGLMHSDDLFASDTVLSTVAEAFGPIKTSTVSTVTLSMSRRKIPRG